MNLPDPYREIRPLALRTLRGANFWSRRPVTRMDLWPGAYDEISSAEVPGFTDALLAALPGLVEHRCSIGERGGFIIRLRRGTYAPHIAEHVGLELQSLAGHEVGYGRARGGDRPGEYTVVMEHLHAAVGLRAAALGLELVQHALVGRLEPGWMEAAVGELRALAATPDQPPLHQQVLCGITGGGDRAGARAEMLRRGVSPAELVVEVAPVCFLHAGLPYARSPLAVVLDDQPGDVPERYREPEAAAQLLSVPADAVRAGGMVLCPATAWEVQERARDAGCRVEVFSSAAEVPARDAGVAQAVGVVRAGRILLEREDGVDDLGPLRARGPAAEVQVAAALAAAWLAGPGAARAAEVTTNGGDG